jgi:uncharacterized membrane protein/YHS domain-containing protein
MKLFSLISIFLFSVVSATAEPINEMCPVTPDEPTEPWITTEYEGETIGFCCKSCMRKFNANPEAYLENLKASPNSHGGEVHAEHGDSRSVAASGEKSHPADGHGHADDAVSTSGNEPEEHDHSTDHGSENGASPSWLILLGKLHVLAVHLPIALLPLAGALEGLGMIRKSPAWLFAARTNFVVGSIMAIIAASLGWIAAGQSNYSGDLAEILFLHRWVGVSVAVFAALGLAMLLPAVRGNEVALRLYRIVIFLLIVLVAVAAYLGGSLIYGIDYLF